MNIRTDLALEQAKELGPTLPKGVTLEEREVGEAQVTTVRIASLQGEVQLGKPRGSYITVDGAPFAETVEDNEDQVKAASQALAELLPGEGLVLVVGLGNDRVTPDALGPRVIHHILATRHIEQEVAGEAGLKGLRPVAAIAPGVLAQTGLEAGEIASWIAREVKPCTIIAIDALAASESARLGRTIQISDAGIVPGSGVRGSRKALSRETLGVPVISMGVPTVVDASVFVSQYLEKVGVDAEVIAASRGEPLMVTPHQIDLIIDRSAKIMALAINLAIQRELSPRDVRFLMS